MHRICTAALILKRGSVRASPSLRSMRGLQSNPPKREPTASSADVGAHGQKAVDISSDAWCCGTSPLRCTSQGSPQPCLLGRSRQQGSNEGTLFVIRTCSAPQPTEARCTRAASEPQLTLPYMRSQGKPSHWQQGNGVVPGGATSHSISLPVVNRAGTALELPAIDF